MALKRHLMSAAGVAVGLIAGLALAICGACLLAGMFVIAMTIRAHDWLEQRS